MHFDIVTYCDDSFNREKLLSKLLSLSPNELWFIKKVYFLCKICTLGTAMLAQIIASGFWWVIFQRGEYTKPMGFNEWFFKGGVHKTNGLWWVSFQRGEYTKLMAFWWVSFQRGGVHKTDGFWWVFGMFLLLLKNKRPGCLFRQIRWQC